MDKLKISVLNVGHGDFIFITTPNYENLIIDCGSGENEGEIVPNKFLNNVNTIHELQISHPHLDHFYDILGLANKSILSFRCPSLNKLSDTVAGLTDNDKKKIKKLKELKASIKSNNDSVPSKDGFSHTVWFPKNIDSENPNSLSYVTTVSYKNFKMLFGGDLQKEGWEELLKKDDFVKAIKGTTFLKVSHHGREDGCSEKLMDILKPTLRLCIISDKSLEKDNKNTANTQWYSDRVGKGILFGDTERKVLTTRNDGSIHIHADNKGMWTVWRNTHWKAD